jgi:hypothetical protein
MAAFVCSTKTASNGRGSTSLSAHSGTDTRQPLSQGRALRLPGWLCGADRVGQALSRWPAFSVTDARALLVAGANVAGAILICGVIIAWVRGSVKTFSSKIKERGTIKA